MRWAAHQNDSLAFRNTHPALNHTACTEGQRWVLDNIIQTNVQASGFSRSSKGETRRLISDVHDWGYIRANAVHQFDANTEASGHSHMAGNSHVDYGDSIYRGTD
jgi:hypothetical protein